MKFLGLPVSPTAFMAAKSAVAIIGAGPPVNTAAKLKADRGAAVAQARRDAALTPEQHLIPHVTPLGWEHIDLTGEITSGATRQRQLRAKPSLRAA